MAIHMMRNYHKTMFHNEKNPRRQLWRRKNLKNNQREVFLNHNVLNVENFLWFHHFMAASFESVLSRSITAFELGLNDQGGRENNSNSKHASRERWQYSNFRKKHKLS
jgi:hypothetical protein